MRKIRNLTIFPILLISITLHSLILLSHFKINDKVSLEHHQFRIKNIRKIGEKVGSSENLLYLKKKKPTPKKTPKLENLAFTDLPIPSDKVEKSKSKLIRTLDLNNSKVKDFLKSTPRGHLSPSQALQALNDTNVDIKLEVPKGIQEDELNKHEMVFYSFQKRTVLAYVNSFQKELNNFERKNPQLRFPLTSEKQKLSGRVVYDKNGDILRIETLKWSQIKKLQDMFMKVLNNMSSLPNPPKEIIDEDKEQFAINFVLTLNN